MDRLRAAGSLSRTDAAAYLKTVLASWPVGKNGLYATYGTDRHDIYDNAVMALALMATAAGSSPPPAVLRILTFFSTQLETLTDAKFLLEASFGDGDDPNDFAQDTGNNAWVGIALARFARQYPKDPNTPRFMTNANFLLTIFWVEMKCNTSAGVKRRWPLTTAGNGDVSTEHNIDVFALGQLATQTAGDVAGGVATVAATFVKSMFSQNRYLIGTMQGCTVPNVNEYPVDCQTWKLLSGVDNVLDRDQAAMQWALDGAIQPNSPGVAFAASPGVPKEAQCAQYEVTGGAFAALNEFVLCYPGAPLPASADTLNKLLAAASLMRGWVAANKPIIAARTPSADVAHYKSCEKGNCCSCIGDGWDYEVNTMHLSATAWTVFGLAGMADPVSFNPFQYRPRTPPEPKVSCTSWQIVLLVIGLMLVYLLVVVVVLTRRKRAA